MILIRKLVGSSQSFLRISIIYRSTIRLLAVPVKMPPGIFLDRLRKGHQEALQCSSRLNPQPIPSVAKSPNLTPFEAISADEIYKMVIIVIKKLLSAIKTE